MIVPTSVNTLIGYAAKAGSTASDGEGEMKGSCGATKIDQA
jgi:hypothetical protein